MQIELTPRELKYIRAALTLVIVEHEELIETGRFAREVGDETVVGQARESAEYEEALRVLLLTLPSASNGP
jgi:hypothetical protein